jgi:hypothetical protein
MGRALKKHWLAQTASPIVGLPLSNTVGFSQRLKGNCALMNHPLAATYNRRSPMTEGGQADPQAGSSTISVAIIYEDFASGVRAKRFTERLATELRCTCQLSDSLWKSELLEYSTIAGAAALVTATSDYILVSLRGERILPFAARQWIETQLDTAELHIDGLIVLADYRFGKVRVLEGLRRYLRCICSTKGVPFFSYPTLPPPRLELAETSDRTPSNYRWLPALRYR